MDAERERIEAARRRNLELDEQEAARAAEELLASVAGQFAATTGDSSSSAALGKPAAPKSARSNATSVYVTGLSTYLACRQLETLCSKIGKVRRIKFYKDNRGGLKGDAVVAFHSHAAMLRAIERLDGFEIKPGVIITASVAEFSKKRAAAVAESDAHDPANNQEPSVETQDAGASQVRDAPSRSVVLEHVWDPLAPQEGTGFFDELEQDMRSECAKHGQVENIHIGADGSVLVRFAEPASAIQCQRVMDGRWFDGRQIVSRMDNGGSSDVDSVLEAFLAGIDT